MLAEVVACHVAPPIALSSHDATDAWLPLVVPTLLEGREKPPGTWLVPSRPELDKVPVDGLSARLARALAAFGEITRSQPLCDTVVTGDVRPDGSVHGVSFVAEKLSRIASFGVMGPLRIVVPEANLDDASAAVSEAPAGSVLVGVRSVDEAIACVFGPDAVTAAGEIGTLRREVERLRDDQRRWEELLAKAERLVAVADRARHAAGSYHGRLAVLLALRRAPDPITWRGQQLRRADFRAQLDAELNGLEQGPTVWPELRAQRANFAAIEHYVSEDSLAFTAGVERATRGLELCAHRDTPSEYRKLLGTRAQLRTAAALQFFGVGLAEAAQSMASSGVRDVLEARRLAPAEPYMAENDAARVRVYAFRTADVAEAFGDDSALREGLEHELMDDLRGLVTAGRGAPVQDPVWALLALVPSWLRRVGAADTARRLKDIILAAEFSCDSFAERELLAPLVQHTAREAGDQELAAWAARLGPGRVVGLRSAAWWGKPPGPEVVIATAATATQRRWAASLDDPDEGLRARRALLLWCGDPLGLVVGASTDEGAS
jgi:hypothetical protein